MFNVLNAQIAQLVEQRTENPRVAGSIPALGIFFISGDISLRGGMIWAERDKKDFTVSFCCILNGRK